MAVEQEPTPYDDLSDSSLDDPVMSEPTKKEKGKRKKKKKKRGTTLVFWLIYGFEVCKC